MFVEKRNKEPRTFDKEKFFKSIQNHCEGLDKDYVSADEFTEKIILGIKNNMKTKELSEYAAETAASCISIHPDFGVLASRILAGLIQKTNERTFSEKMEFLHSNTKYISDSFIEIIKENKDFFNGIINYERDHLLSYFGLRTLLKSYILHFKDTLIETPQDLFLRISIGIHMKDIEAAKETYDLMSQKYFIHATPTLFNAGGNRTQMSSCFLLTMKDDSAAGIFETLIQCGTIARFAGGLGVNISHVRARGSPLSTGGSSNGIIPMIKMFESMTKFISQCGNKRSASVAFFLEPWHPEILEFLDLRKNSGSEEMRSRSIFTGLWIPDLFMRRVNESKDWCLFCPNIAKGLNDVYGEEFEALYEKYEREEKYTKKIPAQKIWRAIIESQIETGTPYILYKDACNRKSNQKNLGTIKGSNLCAEILEFTSEDEVAVCNLASIGLPSFINNSQFDFKKLIEVTKVCTRNLNKVIDLNFYPVKESENSNLKHRPIAIGVQGLADTFAILKIPFDSEEALKLNEQIFETIYFAAVEESCNLAERDGPYSTFEGSPISKGLFQFDLWNKKADMYDWETLRKRVMKFGVRNSLLTACMPTASTSQILGFNECIEPFTSNIYARRTLAGEFQVVNKHLITELIKLNLWTKEIKNEMISNDGSIQDIDEIPNDIKLLYRTVWEYKMKAILDLSISRGPFIDQTQSLNVFMSNPTLPQLTSMHFYGWNGGLKTGMYYLRTQPTSTAIKFTVDKEMLKKPKKMSCNINDENCQSCSA